MYSSVLVTNACSWVATLAFASAIAAATDSAVCSRPLAMTSSPAYRVSPFSRTIIPSLTLANRSGPASSTSGMPASRSSCGPWFG